MRPTDSRETTAFCVSAYPALHTFAASIPGPSKRNQHMETIGLAYVLAFYVDAIVPIAVVQVSPGIATLPTRDLEHSHVILIRQDLQHLDHPSLNATLWHRTPIMPNVPSTPSPLVTHAGLPLICGCVQRAQGVIRLSSITPPQARIGNRISCMRLHWLSIKNTRGHL